MQVVNLEPVLLTQHLLLWLEEAPLTCALKPHVSLSPKQVQTRALIPTLAGTSATSEQESPFKDVGGEAREPAGGSLCPDLNQAGFPVGSGQWGGGEQCWGTDFPNGKLTLLDGAWGAVG